ncbi:hypothetical protein [Duganella sacchari]|nr:hypothetical protein [Duganella sacchari]
MKFRIQTTYGGEVIWAGQSAESRTVYYGGPPQTGLWRLSIPAMEDYIAARLAGLDFGTSIEEFILGFELAELEGWGVWFHKTKEYMSYRPKMKAFVSVGQVEWTEVKELPAEQQFKFFSDALIAAVNRIATAKRKPKDFDYAALSRVLQYILNECDISLVCENEADD